jgi:hypothetical protein
MGELLSQRARISDELAEAEAEWLMLGEQLEAIEPNQ